MHTHWLFIYNVGAHLVASMSSLVSFGIAVYEATRHKKFETWAFFVLGAICLVIAFDQAWQDEHRNSQLLIAQRAEAVSENNFWKDQSYAKDEAIRTRDRLLEQSFITLSVTQSSLAQLSNKILDVTKPEARTIHSVDLGPMSGGNIAKYQEQFVLLVNKMIVPVHMLVKCDKPIVSAGGAILGSRMTMLSDLWAGPRPDGSYGIGAGGGMWGPLSPLLVTVYFNDGDQRKCSFDEQ